MGDYLHLRRPTIWIHSSGEEASVWVGGGLPRFSRHIPLVAYHISTRLTHPNGAVAGVGKLPLRVALGRGVGRFSASLRAWSLSRHMPRLFQLAISMRVHSDS